jgi:RHS repeat-associated protein
MTDATGAVRARYDYDPFGRVTQLAGDKTAVFRYTGHLFHEPTGLSFARHRAYDPSFGRWISEDPLGFGVGPNLYTYVNNDPVDAIDPSGLVLWKCARKGDGWFFSSTKFFCDEHRRNCSMGDRSTWREEAWLSQRHLCPTDGDGPNGTTYEVLSGCRQGQLRARSSPAYLLQRSVLPRKNDEEPRRQAGRRIPLVSPPGTPPTGMPPARAELPSEEAHAPTSANVADETRCVACPSFGGLLAGGAECVGIREWPRRRFCACDDSQPEHLKRISESSIAPTTQLSRNGAGTQLYVYGHDENGRDRKVLIVGSKAHQAVTKPAAIAYLNDESRWVAWFDKLSDGLQFPDGTRRRGEDFGVDRSGRYFFAVQGWASTEIGETNDPTKTLGTVRQRKWIFSGEDRVYLNGRLQDTSDREIA